MNFTKFIQLILINIYLLAHFLSFKAMAANYRFPVTNTDHSLRSEVFSIKRSQKRDESYKAQFLIRDMFSSKVANEDFEQLEFTDLELTKREGFPSLPYKNVLVLGDADKLEVSYDLGRAFNFNKIRPAPAAIYPCRCDKDEKIKLIMNESIYYSGGNRLYKVKKLGLYRGKKISVISFFPGKVDAKEGFTLYPNISFNIKSKRGQDEEFTILNSNSDLLNNFTFTEEKGNRHYVIISPQKLTPALEDFVEWKKEQGFLVHLYIKENIGDDKDDIKIFLKEIYEKISMSFVLLIGDEESFPTYYVETSNDFNTPSDLPYFLMDGNTDEIPDVFYGRISANNIADIEAQLKKSMNFEKQNYSKKMVIGIASNEGDGPTDVEYMDQMIAPLLSNLNFTERLFLQDRKNSKAININKALEEGAVWMNYIGHGDGSSWSSIFEGNYSTRHVDSLLIQKATPVIIDVACQNGRMSDDDRLGSKFMNIGLFGGKVGATAYYGGSVDISWHPPAIMAVGINKFLSRGKVKSLGEVLLLGQLYLIENYDDQAAALENLVWYHLQGDPSLDLSPLY